MSNFFGAVFGIGVILYFIVCGLIIPLQALAAWQQRSECERSHNVFECEVVISWQPVKQETGK